MMEKLTKPESNQNRPYFNFQQSVKIKNGSDIESEPFVPVAELLSNRFIKDLNKIADLTI